MAVVEEKPVAVIEELVTAAEEAEEPVDETEEPVVVAEEPAEVLEEPVAVAVTEEPVTVTVTEEPVTLTVPDEERSGTLKVAVAEESEDAEAEEEKPLMQKVKDAGTAGIISYIFWEWAFWGVSVPVACFGFQAATGHWPDFTNQEDLAKLGAEAFAFVNVARFAIPLRIGLALGTTPWVQENIVDKFQKKDAA